MSSFLTTLGLMVVFYFLFEILSRWSVRMDEQNKHGFLSNAVAFLAAINYALSFAVAGLVTWHDSRTEKIHRKLFLEDRKPYEDVLQSQIATLSSENKRLEGVIEFYKDKHRKEITRISEERRESGYRFGYISGFKNGFDYCLERTEYSGSDESELRSDARSVANYEIKRLFHEKVPQGNSEPSYLMESASGMLVRVPESKLDAWQKAQQGQGLKPTEEQRRIIKEKIIQDIYGSKPENK